MNAKELRMLAAGLHVAARHNIQRGMAPLVDATAMNPAAPFARAPQLCHTGPPLRLHFADGRVIEQQQAVALPSAPHQRPALPPAGPSQQAADPTPPAEGTFFWPGRAEEEIRKERESR